MQGTGDEKMNMERAKWPALSGLVLGSAVLTRASRTTFAYDRPIHSAVFILATSGAICIAISRWAGSRTHKTEAQYESLPLDDLGQPQPNRQHSPEREALDIEYPSSLRKLRIVWCLLILVLCLRAEMARQVLLNVQCGAQSWAPCIPLVFAAWDYWTMQRKRWSKGKDNENMNVNAYEAMELVAARAPYIYLVAAGLISLGGMLALRTTSGPPSTYICAGNLRYRWSIPHLQRFGTALDVLIVYCCGQLMSATDARGTRTTGFKSIGWALLISAGFWFAVGLVYWIVQETGRKWLLTIPSLYFWSVFKLNLYAVFTLICALASILHVGVLTTVTISGFICILTVVTGSAWGIRQPFPPVALGMGFLGVSLALLGFMIYFHAETLREQRTNLATFHRLPSWFYLALLATFFTWTGLWATYHKTANYHPVDMLIYDAESRHTTFLEQSTTSTSLDQAVRKYQIRYDRQPPPGFDRWYEFATSRNSTIIDDFDSIDRDVLPFFALMPEMIRHRTWELISNPWNDVAGLLIRDHKVTVAPNVRPTHKWMLDGLVAMISKFAEWLPDMDLAFNLNDECRVSVPFEHIEPNRKRGRDFGLRPKPESKFTADRATQWQPMPDQEENPDQPPQDTPLTEISWQNTFHRYGNNGCPPSSPARTQRTWDTSSFCMRCAHPHSLGAFLGNWTVAADTCHQPDLADLHGLYLSPAAFKGTHELYPIFSQSKVHGFNDILYPSAWNYLDKAKYDPNDMRPDNNFTEKEDKLFWRGATSEGVSHSDMGQWRGMARQRFIHLANDMNGTNPPMPLLVHSITSSPDQDDQWKYRYLPTSLLARLLPVDVHVVDFIARCFGRDCDDQVNEFSPLFPAIDFQDFWKYKYLLDLDGAGFSGRFLPFLQSRSLPFKAALFREWWDDRVTPWAHFVPLDLRGHGLWATLAYFNGVDEASLRSKEMPKNDTEGRENDIGSDAPPGSRGQGRAIKLEPHVKEAERIATRGREWAQRVLRKEDMEIYFFRLLLEWARLTDDRRDVLGYAGAGG